MAENDDSEKEQVATSRCLSLLGKKLKVFPDLWPTVEELYLAGNELESIPNSICKCSKLRILELGNDVVGNRIASIPTCINTLKSLEVLNLSSNQLQVLPPLHLPRLLKLYLSRNQLRQLPNNLTLPCLREMRLDDNRLIRLPSDTQWIPSHLLDLSGNLLRFIPAYLSTVRRVLLCGNPCLERRPSVAPIVQISHRIPKLTDLCLNALKCSKLPAHLTTNQRCAQCPSRFGCPAGRLIHDAPFQCHPSVCLTADLCHRCINVQGIAVEVGTNGVITLIDIEDL